MERVPCDTLIQRELQSFSGTILPGRDDQCTMITNLVDPISFFRSAPFFPAVSRHIHIQLLIILRNLSSNIPRCQYQPNSRVCTIQRRSLIITVNAKVQRTPLRQFTIGWLIFTVNLRRRYQVPRSALIERDVCFHLLLHDLPINDLALFMLVNQIRRISYIMPFHSR